MSHDLSNLVRQLGRPTVLVVGDVILDRYIFGSAERVSQEAPVPVLRADKREDRLGGAASVASMLSTLGADVILAGVTGADEQVPAVQRLLHKFGLRDDIILPDPDRPTTLKERYIGRAQDRHPQQMIRVDYEVRDPILENVEAILRGQIPRAVAKADLVLISDYDKGVCTPRLLRTLIDACRSAGVRVLADPVRWRDYSRYRGVHCMSPNRLEAQLATGMAIRYPEDALPVGRALVELLGM